MPPPSSPSLRSYESTFYVHGRICSGHFPGVVSPRMSCLAASFAQHNSGKTHLFLFLAEWRSTTWLAHAEFLHHRLTRVGCLPLWLL